ncbi:universal stress protein [Ferrovibrio sp.]|uniref:universal stress protein n=1 Tax=Ferrovibrio sp. TaxID=1917215 RepID=UPI003120526A
MSYRDIMVHLTLDPRNAERIRYAIGLARRFNARLSGLYTVPPPNVPYYMGEYIPTELIQKQMDEAQKASVTAREAFLATCAGAAVEHRWLSSDLAPVEALRVLARASDVVIVGQPDPSPADPAAIPYGTDVLPQELALQAGRPVLAVPHGGPVGDTARSVLVGWNGKREAARAVHDALPLLRAAETVHLVTIAPEKKGRTPQAEIAELLERHGVRLQAAIVEGNGQKVGMALLAEAKARDAELLVMGAFGHSRLREMVFGGVTETVLGNLDLPVLLSN